MAEFFAPERLESDRYVLRTFMPGDGPLLHEAKAGSYDHLRPWLAWAEDRHTRDEHEALVRRFRADFLTNVSWVLGIFAPDEGRLLGGTDFRPVGPVHGWDGEIGMWIRAEESGQGLGSDVLRTMLRWGFSDWPFQRLQWRCDVRNRASARVAENAGMVLEGTLRGENSETGGGRRDTAVYALVRDDLMDVGSATTTADPVGLRAAGPSAAEDVGRP